jgi:hypothetical protein
MGLMINGMIMEHGTLRPCDFGTIEIWDHGNLGPFEPSDGIQPY